MINELAPWLACAQPFNVVSGNIDLPACGAAVVSPAITLMQI
jgi:hypothetical protein